MTPVSDFVRVDGTRFIRRGQLYFICGASLWYAGCLGAPEGAGDRERLVRERDNLRAIGVNNVRVLAVSEATAMKSAVRPATTSAPGRSDENLLAGALLQRNRRPAGLHRQRTDMMVLAATRFGPRFMLGARCKF